MPMMNQQQQAAPTSDQAKQLFEQGFSDMAHNVLINKLPNIANDVVTFKLLSSDYTQGAGVGAFVVVRNGQMLYIPVVMADNQVKPLDLMYYKELNAFLPLTKEWLEELAKMSVEGMGQASKPPKTMPTDVDIRNVVVPPTTGRYSYASEVEQHNVEEMFKQAYAQSETDAQGTLLDFIGKAPNNVKTASALFFKKHPPLYAKLASFYGHTAIEKAFTPHATEKKADYGAKMTHTGALYVADKSTSTSDFKKIFGSESPMAYAGVKVKGYYAKDTRKNLNRPLTIQEYVDLQQTMTAGAYKLWCKHGEISKALIIPNPTAILAHWGSESAHGSGVTPMGGSVPSHVRRSTYRNSMDSGGSLEGISSVGGHWGVPRYVGITEKGKLIKSSRPLVGDSVAMGELSGSAIFKKAVGDSDGTARAGQRGFWLLRRGQSFVATEPVYVKTVRESDGLTRITIVAHDYDDEFENRHFSSKHRHHSERDVIMAKADAGRFVVPTHTDAPVQIPSDATWFKTEGEGLNCDDYLSNPRDIFKWAQQGVLESGATGFTVKKSSQGWLLPFDRTREFGFAQALGELAKVAHISVDDSAAALKIASQTGACTFYSLPLEKSAAVLRYFDKLAGDDAPPKKDKGGDGGGDPSGGSDPAGDAMGGVPQAPTAPAAPSPTDMAVAEQMQNIQMQMQALMAQQTVLTNLQQRANMIAGYGGAMGAPAAAATAMGGPMDPSMTGQGGMPAPQPQGGQPPPQQGAPQGQPQGGQPPPQQGGGQPMPAPSAQPAPGGMPQQGMAPQAQGQGGQQGGQQAPPAMMTAEDGDPNTIAQQVNPQYAQQAGQLNDAGAFDAAALGSMAQAPALKDLVAAYLPNMEKALDNVGRMLLTLWMDEGRIKEDIGDETYIGVETNLRNVLRGMGDLILKIHQNTAVLRGPNDQNFAV